MQALENPVYHAALKYIEQGYHLTPCWSPRMLHAFSSAKWRGRPINPSAKVYISAGHWQDPLVTKAEVDEWFKHYPWANIQLCTGQRSRFLVVDQDDYSTGIKTAVAELNLPATRMVKTGGGVHYYYTIPAGMVLPSTYNGFFGHSILAEKGSVVAPPSLHANGQRYQWVDEHVPIAAFPEWAIRHVQGLPMQNTTYCIWRFYWRPRLKYILPAQVLGKLGLLDKEH